MDVRRRVRASINTGGLPAAGRGPLLGADDRGRARGARRLRRRRFCFKSNVARALVNNVRRRKGLASDERVLRAKAEAQKSNQRIRA